MSDGGPPVGSGALVVGLSVGGALSSGGVGSGVVGVLLALDGLGVVEGTDGAGVGSGSGEGFSEDFVGDGGDVPPVGGGAVDSVGDDPPSVGEEPPPDDVVFRSVGVEPLPVGDPSVGDPSVGDPPGSDPPVSEGSLGPGPVPVEPEPDPDPDPDPDPGSESSVLPSEVLPGQSTRRATAAPNFSSVPGPGLDPVTGASPGGIPSPATVTARPLSAMAALASPKVIPRTLGTACRARVSNVVSDSPVVPTSRLMPWSGSSTSTSLISLNCSGAGLTTTTADLS